MATPAASTDTSEPVSFQEAFTAAREEHSKVATETTDEHAAAEEVSTDDDGDDAPPARSGKAEPAPATTAKTKSDPAALLSDEEFAALQTTHADDPVKLRKALEGAFTTKTQALAAERRSVERLQSYADIIDAYESDPVATIRELARQNGMEFTPDETPAGETPAGTGSTDATTTVDAVLTEFKEALGPELEYLADGLAPAITKLVERLAAAQVAKAVDPLKKGTEQLLSKAATEQTETIMKGFGEKYPDWQTHEPAMLALAQKLSPNGMDEAEYLDHLYALVTRDTSAKTIDAKVADGVKKAIAKMEQGARNTEGRDRETPDGKVTTGPPAGRAPDFHEAYAAAKRGERWE